MTSTKLRTIGIDYTPAYEQGGGIGRYVRELVKALALIAPREDVYRLFVAGADKSSLPATPSNHFEWHPSRITPAWFARLWHRANIPLPVEMFTGALDIYHATDFVLPPTHKKTRTLLTVHDLSFVRVPETAQPSLKAYLDRVVPKSVQRADHIVADSTATKEDLIALYNTPPDKITVLLSGVESRFHPITDISIKETLQKKYYFNRPYIFAVGTVQPRKNYERLIQAVAQVRAQGTEIDLVISGGKGWLDHPIFKSIDDLNMKDHVHLIGYADDADLPALYSFATVVATPSLYEGFGLPVLEGMACGTPVLTANISSLPEVAGDGAVLIDPYNVDEMAQGLHQLIHDDTLRGSLRTRGLKRATELTWERSARQLLGIYSHL